MTDKSTLEIRLKQQSFGGLVALRDYLDRKGISMPYDITYISDIEGQKNVTVYESSWFNKRDAVQAEIDRRIKFIFEDE